MARRKKADANLRKFKKSNVWITLVFFLISSILTIVFVSLFVSAFLSYITDSKMTGEYNSAVLMAKTYEKVEKAGAENPGEFVESEGRDFYVKDAKGNILYQQGEITNSDNHGRLGLSSFSRGVDVYLDSESDSFILEKDEKDGNLEIDSDKLVKWILEKKATYVQLADARESAIALPFWFCVDIDDGQKQFFSKAYLRADLRDSIFMLVFAVAIGFQLFTIFVLMLINVITSAVSQRKMTRIFFTDAVTKEHNWMYFLVRSDHLLRHGKSRKFNYAVLDLVFVKYRNFCVCHSVEEGEALLRKVDSLVRKKMNKKEVCAHYASANFALLKQYNTKEELDAWISTLIGELETMDSAHHFAFHIGADLLPVTMNEKGKVERRRDLNLEKEYNNACTARATLEESDDSGYAFFDEKLVEEQKWIDTVHEEQQSALDNEEFIIYYQPKYDPRTRKLKGAEALIRWNSPKHGMKAPYTIIPIFEKNGFIVNIDHYMISHVAKDQKRWLDAGFDCVPISVNVSRAHFIENDLAEQIRDMVDAAGCPHELIELEVTESAFFDDKKALVTTIQKLQEYGFMVSMDDFGSGYSSLNSLKDMPLNILKLDAGFFSGDLENERGEIVVSEAIRLAKSLHMETVAEGVELKEQVEFLARQGCDMIQGFYFARPMPPEKYEEKMASGVATDEDVAESAAAGTAVEASAEEALAEAAPEAETPAPVEESMPAEESVPVEETPAEEVPAEAAE